MLSGPALALSERAVKCWLAGALQAEDAFSVFSPSSCAWLLCSKSEFDLYARRLRCQNYGRGPGVSLTVIARRNGRLEETHYECHGSESRLTGGKRTEDSFHRLLSLKKPRRKPIEDMETKNLAQVLSIVQCLNTSVLQATRNSNLLEQLHRNLALEASS